MEALRLDRRVGRDPAEHPSEAIAAFEPPADALRIELRGEVVAGKGETVGRHPVVGEGEGRGEIGRAGLGRAVDAGLEGIALAAAQPLRQAPIGAAAGEGEAHHRIGREAIVEAAGHAHRARGHVVAADHGEIAAGAVAAAIGAAPRRPARLVDRWQGLLRCLEHRGIGERDLGRRVVALGRKAERGVIGTADAAASVDEGIEHQIEELVGELEADRLRAGRGFAGKLVQGAGEIVAGEAEERHEGRRQRTAVVEEVIDRIADVELIDGEGRWRRRSWRRRTGRRRWRVRRWNELGRQVEDCGIAGIAQARLEVRR